MAEVSSSPVPDAQLFRDAFNASPIGIAVENLDGLPLFVNPAFCRFLGFTEIELCSKHCVDFSPRDDAEKDWALFQQLKAGSIDHYQMEKRYFRRDGSLVWGSLSISLFKGRSSPLVLAMVEDITEKKNAEEELRSSEERLRLAAQIGKMYAYSWDAITDEVVRSPEYVNVLGVSDQHRFTRQQLLEKLHPDDRARWIASAADLTPDNPTCNVTYRVLRPNGSEVWLEKNARAFFDTNGRMLRVIGMVADVTERKRAHEALQASEQRLRLAQQAARLGTFERDIRSGRITWAEGLEPLYGLPPGSLEGKTLAFFRDLIHPSDREQAEYLIQRALKTGESTEGEWRAIWPDGSIHWIASRWQVLMDDFGEPSRVIGVNMDVTERKKADEALRVSEERLRLAQQAARIGSFEWNIRTGANTWTPELETMYGLPPGGFGGTQTAFKNLLHPDDRTRVMKLADISLKTAQPTTGEWRVIWPDGSVHWIASRWQVFMDDSGEPLRMAGVNIDVTERKLAEQKLREYERAVEGSGEMIVVVDREYRYVIANRQFLKMRNMTTEQVVGHPVRELMTRPELFDEVVKPKLDECFQGKVVRYEMKYPYPQLGERDLLVSYFPIEGDGGIHRATCILHDITERKRAEESLADMSRKLLEAQEQERARIGRELHDDINQRLALLAIDLQRMEDSPSKPQSQARRIREQLDQISSDVQALSHELHSSKLHYLGVLAGIRSWAKDFAERQRLEIDFSSDVSSPIPFEIGLSLFRVIQEAVHNCVKHSGVKRVEVEIRQDSSAMHLTICDSGKGFDVESAMHGKGLGLTSMRERVRLINGTISIESRPMQGTTINVHVPLESEKGSQRAVG